MGGTSAQHLGKTRSLPLLPLPGSRWSASDSQFVIFGLLGLRSYLLCALRSAVRPHGRVNNTVWFLLSTDCSWNVPQLSGNRLILRFQHADAREFPSAHLPRQRAGLRVGPALGTAAKLDCAWITSLYALRQIQKTQVGLVRENNRKRKGDVQRQRKWEERWGGSRRETAELRSHAWSTGRKGVRSIGLAAWS